MVRNDQGASAVEYSLLAAFIAAVIVAVVVLVGRPAVANYSSVVDF